MRVITDLHIHSRYSRACSKQLDLPNIAKWCEIKGIDVVGTGDFTYPAWFKSIQEDLEEVGAGIFALKNNKSKTRFLLSTELSLIYKQGDKVRRVHLCILLSKIESLKKLISLLEARGCNLKSDGRPILGMRSPELVKMVLEADPQALIIPAHAWTPHFAVFGSGSGFDSLEECFEDTTENIFAIETGLSSDPKMNWQWSKLDNISLVSNSDAHSLRNLGREANVFVVDNFDYKTLYHILKTRNKEKFAYTIEFYPEEGKYHYDGHRACNISFTPSETKKHNGICPSCKKKLVLGVMNRVASLSDRPGNFLAKNRVPYKSIVPLEIIISEAVGKGVGTKSVAVIYEKMISELGNEFGILLDQSIKEIARFAPEAVVRGIENMRQNKLFIEPGFDGVFGKVKLFKAGEKTIPVQSKIIIS